MQTALLAGAVALALFAGAAQAAVQNSTPTPASATVCPADMKRNNAVTAKRQPITVVTCADRMEHRRRTIVITARPR